MKDLEQLLKSIKGQMDIFLVDSAKIGNKAAAVRARKASLRLTKEMKMYRKLSIK